VTPPAARLTDVTVRFGGTVALDRVGLAVRPGERVGVLGASGAGKSTMLALLTGAQSPSSGRVEVLGAELAALTPRALGQVRRRVGFVSQRLDLVDQARVIHNVNAGRLARWGTMRAFRELLLPRVDDEVASALAAVGLDWAAFQRMERLSGGERQRVALARVLVQRPELVVADEPVASLDPVRSATMLGLLDDIAGEGALVVSLHQPELARSMCTRIVGLRDGHVRLDAPVGVVGDADLADLYAPA
jgi:phosphonate transport system ATP-binding protein